MDLREAAAARQAIQADDVALVARLADRDEAALKALYDRYGRLVFSLALRTLADREAAEEVVQEVFLKLWREPDRYLPERGPFWGWLCSVVRHRAVDELRSRNRRVAGLSQLQQVTPTSTAADELDEATWLSERRERVRAALAELPEAERAVLELAYFQGLSQSEMAEQLDQPLGTVKTRVRRGMQRLRTKLQGEDLEEQ